MARLQKSHRYHYKYGQGISRFVSEMKKIGIRTKLSFKRQWHQYFPHMFITFHAERDPLPMPATSFTCKSSMESTSVDQW